MFTDESMQQRIEKKRRIVLAVCVIAILPVIMFFKGMEDILFKDWVVFMLIIGGCAMLIFGPYIAFGYEKRREQKRPILSIVKDSILLLDQKTRRIHKEVSLKRFGAITIIKRPARFPTQMGDFVYGYFLATTTEKEPIPLELVISLSTSVYLGGKENSVGRHLIDKANSVGCFGTRIICDKKLIDFFEGLGWKKKELSNDSRIYHIEATMFTRPKND